ncbi:MAG: acyl-CoA/acyl-ACP dehydrogenase [Firmicutes bacterium]|nr:acyl-CoA/acyl-ACP dehydrogenase [Bacillota bacterium]
MDYLDLNLDLDADQIALKRSVRQFAREVLRPAARELDRLTAEEVLKSELYWDTLRQAKRLGYHTAYIPENHGGLGLPPLELQIFLEELGWGSAGFAVALGVDTMPATVAVLMDDPMLNEAVIAAYVNDKEADFVGCWAITEPDQGSDWVSLIADAEEQPYMQADVTAVPDGGDWVINGTKAAWISNGPSATHALLFVQFNPGGGDEFKGGIAVCPLNLSGVSRGKPLEKLGQRELLQGEIYFDQVRLPGEYMVIDEELFPTMGETVLAYANAGMAAMFTGVARAAFEEALVHTRQRRQGGKLLCEYDNVKGKLFEMFTSIEAARSLSRAALGYNMQTMPPATRYSIAAKVFCTETAFRVTHEAINLFGGAGLSREYYVEKLFRDAKAALIEDGSNDLLGPAAMNAVLREYR